MPQQPTIIVQLIHIHGPLKGTIQEFSDPEITIGRHPSCHVHFPKDLTTISRHHARIIREGNRFKLVDQSVNGTFIRGKRITETYLNPGDVLILAEENGPKISFLAEIRSDAQASPSPPTPTRQPPPPPREIYPGPPEPNGRTFEMAPEIPPPVQAPAPAPPLPSPAPVIEKVKAPLAIQYGPTLKAFKELPVTVGRHPEVDFPLDHPDVLDRHLQIFFSVDRYGVKDLTGRRMVSVNGQPVEGHALLHPNDRLRLGPKGPSFQFLAGGRLAEIEEPGAGSPGPQGAGAGPREAPAQPAPKGRLIDKLFNR